MAKYAALLVCILSLSFGWSAYNRDQVEQAQVAAAAKLKAENDARIRFKTEENECIATELRNIEDEKRAAFEMRRMEKLREDLEAVNKLPANNTDATYSYKQ